MSLADIYNQMWDDENPLTKLSSDDQEAFGRLAARGFMEKISALWQGHQEEFEKEAAKGIDPATAAKKARVLKGLARAGAVGGGVGGAAAVGHSRGRKTEREENIQAVRAYLKFLRERGHLR